MIDDALTMNISKNTLAVNKKKHKISYLEFKKFYITIV